MQQKRKTNTVAAGFVANGFNGLLDWNLNWAGYEQGQLGTCNYIELAYQLAHATVSCVRFIDYKCYVCAMEILLLDRITKHARAGYKHIYIHTTYNMLCSQICRLFIAVIVLSARAKLLLLFIIITIIFGLKQNLFPTWARIIFSV